MKIKKYASLGVLVLLVLSIMSGCSLTPQHKAITDTQFRHAMDVEGFTVVDNTGDMQSIHTTLATYGVVTSSNGSNDEHDFINFITCTSGASASALYDEIERNIDQEVFFTKGKTETAPGYKKYVSQWNDTQYYDIQVGNTVIFSEVYLTNIPQIDGILKKLGYSN